MRFLPAAILISLFQGAKADLPIHALMSDVIGTWTIRETKNSSDHPKSCGSGAPNSNLENIAEQSSEQFSRLSYSDISERTLTLTSNLINKNGEPHPRNEWGYLSVISPSKQDANIGTWTMVYDEGFEIRLGNKRYFGFLKYVPKEGSDCPKHLNGDNENDFGETKCYVTDPSTIHIGWSVEETHENGITKHKWGCFQATKSSNTLMKQAVVLENHGFHLPSLLSEEVAQKHNQTSKTWTAKRHEQFMDSTPKELALHIGQHGFQKIHPFADYKLPAFLQKDQKFSGMFACTRKDESFIQTSSLPKFWNWGDASESLTMLDRDVTNQGNCGSCYAVSAAYVLQKRFEILLNKLFPNARTNFFDTPLSAQSIISCSPFNQGCDGGYPFLVGKHAKEFGLGTTSCQKYVASHDYSEAPCLMNIGDVKRTPKKSTFSCTPEERWYARDYNYVGGFYEACNEEKIKQEIYHHGPVIVAIDAPEALFMYEDGIFDTRPGDHGKICDLKERGFNGWEFTNHAVAVVGWGEESSNVSENGRQKYWIVRNTWGPSWGQHGYMKMKRGENLAGIESQAVLIDPDLTRGKAAQLIAELRRHQRKTSS